MARRKGIPKIYTISVALHLALGLGVALIPKQKLREVVAIVMAETRKPDEKPAEPLKHEEPPKQRPVRSPTQQLARSSNSPPEATEAAPVAFTDIGIALDSNSEGGLALNIAQKPSEEAKAPAPVDRPKPKILSARRTDDTCHDALVKAKPVRLAQPQYTEEARRAQVEGRVRVEVMIDESGAVTRARVLSGLGHGLDQAALAAAERIRFSPATLCGHPVAAPFVISMRFVLAT